MVIIAPTFNGDLKTAIGKDGKSVSRSWNAATAINQEVIGYRVYVNGQPI
ncbi:hypothetical protein [Neobacillus drentensis]